MNQKIISSFLFLLLTHSLFSQETSHEFQRPERQAREEIINALHTSPHLRHLYHQDMRDDELRDHLYSDWAVDWKRSFPSTVGSESPIQFQSDGVHEAWVSRYASGKAPNDEVAVDVAVDAAGNVYITGYAVNMPYGNDFLTAKYSADGELIWTALYNGNGNDNDYAVAIGLDAAGNIYVSGTSYGVGRLNRDFVTIKYSPDGVEQWLARYDAPSMPEYGGDDLSAMVVDSAGNVYVTGDSPSSGTSTGFATIKYNSDGAEQWVAAHHSTKEFARISDLSIDAIGNVYIAGRIDDMIEYNPEYLTVKYDKNGVEQWQANGPKGGENIANAIFVDKQGSVYVTGFGGDATGASYGYLTIKYDNNGQQLWAASYDGPADSRREAFDIIVDDMGNVYVTGENDGILTTKYNKDGEEDWTARYGGWAGRWDAGYRIQLDAGGDVIVAGGLHQQGENQSDFCILKYDPTGYRKWAVTYDGDGGYDRALGLAVDQSHNIYVTGYSNSSVTGSDCATMKYDSDGIRKWLSRYDREGNSYDTPVDMAYDDAGNVYILAYSGIAGRGTDFLLIKYGRSGEEEWTATYNGPDNSDDWPVALAVDAFGNIFVTGDNFGSENVVTIKYGREGTEIWRMVLDEPETYESSTAIAVDAAGNAYVTGEQFHNDWDKSYSNYITVKYDSDGEVVWLARDDNDANPVDLSVDAAGKVYVTGSIDDDNSPSRANYNFLTIKYDATGKPEWSARYDGPSPHDFAQAIALDAKNNVYVLGQSFDDKTGSDYAVVKYGNKGTEKWIARFDDDSWDRPTDFAVDLSSNVVVTGISCSGTDCEYATVKFNATGNLLWVARGARVWTNSLALDGFGNVYVTGETFGAGTNDDFTTLKYDADGQLQWQVSHNSPENAADRPKKVAVDAWGNVYVTGATGGYNGSYITTIKYAQPEGSETPRTFNLSQNYPNPFNTGTAIRYRLENASRVTLKIYNLLGQKVDQLIDTGQAPGEYEVRWNPATVPSGTYIYRLETQPAGPSGKGFDEVKKLVLLK